LVANSVAAARATLPVRLILDGLVASPLDRLATGQGDQSGKN
jgi:hypothetical protein